MQDTLYGLLRSELIFYLNQVKYLEAFGFEKNPYNHCVANNIINGQQMTSTWHVDDLKVSYKDPYQVTKFPAYISSVYGKNLNINRGKVHDYLGLDLDYYEYGKVKISMINYVQKILDNFPEEIGNCATSPAADHLFQVRDEYNPTM